MHLYYVADAMHLRRRVSLAKLCVPCLAFVGIRNSSEFDPPVLPDRQDFHLESI